MNKITPPAKPGNNHPLLIAILLLFLTVFPGNALSLTSTNSAVQKQIKPGMNAAVSEYEPAVAVRASGCLTCHAEIVSNYITDFGYGSPYFFSNPASKNKVGIFNGHIYGDFIADPGKTSWLTADFQKQIIIPKAPVDFNLEDAAGNALTDKSSYREALKAASLAEYIRALESKKNRPSSVIEKKKVFIGAPDIETLEAGFKMKPGENISFKYIKSDPAASPDMKGIELSKDENYYTNTDEIECDGDLFIRGILFLNRPLIHTNTGCRIYATGPVFFQGELTFKNSDGAVDKRNLQLVSTEAIFLGVGHQKCNTTEKTDPLSLRLLKTPALPSIFTRTQCIKNVTPQRFMQDLYDKAALVPLEDSSCHDIATGFSRLLLNAPIINSRYSGKFKGLVIAEYALFSQGKTNLEFDPVFKEVPVLPVLKEEAYLLIE